MTADATEDDAAAARAAATRRRTLLNGAISWVMIAAGNVSAYVAFRPHAPRLVVDGWGLFIAALLGWLAFLLIVGLARPRALPPDRVARHRAIVELWTWASVLAVILLLMPHGPVALQLVTLLFVAGYAATTVISSADAPQTLVPRLAVTLFLLIAVVIVERLPYWPFITVFLILFGLSLIALGRLFERTLGDLAKARREAEGALAARTRFLAAASHDLGQPLQAARLFFGQMSRATDPAARAAASRHADIALGAMERMLATMLDHLRLEGHAISPRMQPVLLNEVIATVVSRLEPVARLSGIRITAVSSRAEVLADPDFLERALSNLVDNAIRHADAGRMVVGVRRHGSRRRLLVVDDGCGLVGADAERLFGEFVQATGVQGGRERGGFGLGLASARRLMRLMGGEAGALVNRRQGAGFFLEIEAV